MTAPYMIIGAHGGIGQDIATRLAAKSLPLYLTARDPVTLNSLKLQQAKIAALNVVQLETIHAAIADADQGDGIKAIAYCVGSIDLKPFKSTQDEEFLRSYELNVLGAVRILRAAEKSLRKANGSVVLFSTIAVQQGFASHSIISTAKGAVEALTRSLAAEWAPDVRVNCIAPSLTRTALASSLTKNQSVVDSIAAMHPLPRLGEPHDAGALAEFLLTEQSSWITGQVLAVDGGRSTLRVKG